MKSLSLRGGVCPRLFAKKMTVCCVFLLLALVTGNLLPAQAPPCTQDTLALTTHQLELVSRSLPNSLSDYEVDIFLKQGATGFQYKTQVQLAIAFKDPLPASTRISLKDKRSFYNFDGEASWNMGLSPDRSLLFAKINRPACLGVEGEGFLGTLQVTNAPTGFADRINRQQGGIVEVVVIHGIRPSSEGAIIQVNQTPNKPMLNAVRVWPTPAQSEVNVSVVPGYFDQLTIFDTQGKIVGTYSLAEKHTFSMDLQALSKGLYFFQFKSPYRSEVKKVLLE